MKKDGLVQHNLLNLLKNNQQNVPFVIITFEHTLWETPSHPNLYNF